MTGTPPKVFISYSHDTVEHQERVLGLADRLRADGIDAEIDQYNAAPAEGWPRWMDRQVRDSDFVIMVCTKTYYRRVMGDEEARKGLGVRWEGNLIYQHLFDSETVNRKFVPVFFEGGTPADIPAPVKGTSYYELEAGYEDLYRRLTNQPRAARRSLGKLRSLPSRDRQWTEQPSSEALGELHNVPELPPHFMPRPNELDPLKGKVLAEHSGHIGVTGVSVRIGVHGMGGIGKSVLAAALARDEEVRRAFPDGLYWITLGQSPDLLTRQADLLWMLAADRVGFADVQQGRIRLQKAIKDGRCLVFVDDVWRLPDAQAFNVIEPPGRLLFTTRNAGLTKSLGAVEHQVGKLTREASLDLLAQASGVARNALPPAAEAVANECDDLPLALTLAGGMTEGQADLWEMVLSALKSADLDQIEGEFPDYPYPHVFAAIEASVDALNGDKERYLDLAVFPEDTPIPEAALRVLWAPDGVGELKTRRMAQRFVDRCLATRDAQSRLLLHSLQGDFVRKRAADAPGRQQRLLKSYRKQCPNGWASGPDDGYFFQYLPWHLARSGMLEELRGLLLDYSWIKAKLAATDIPLLVSDYDLAPEAVMRLVQKAIRLSWHVLQRDGAQLASQLVGRLRWCDRKEIQALLEQIAASETRPWLCPRTDSLLPAGGRLLRIIEAPQPRIERKWPEIYSPPKIAAAVTDDMTRAAVGYEEGTIQMWDLVAGRQVQQRRYEQAITALAITPDAKLVICGANDGMIRIWDVATWQEIACCRGHAEAVRAIALTPDGSRALSGSDDHTIRIWDVATGGEIGCFKGHESVLTMVAVTADGHIVVSRDSLGNLRIWELASCKEVSGIDISSTVPPVVLHPEEVMPNQGPFKLLAVARNGLSALISFIGDFIGIWDLSTSTEARDTRIFYPSFASTVIKAIPGDDQKAVVVRKQYVRSEISTIDLESGQGLSNHESRYYTQIEGFAITEDGKHVIYSEHGTYPVPMLFMIKWDIVRDLINQIDVEGADDLAVSPDGRYVILNNGSTLKVKDLASSAYNLAYVATCRGHKKRIHGLAVTPDCSRIVSGSEDATLRVWDLFSGAEIACYGAHDAINDMALTPDGCRAVLVSDNGAVRVWDLSAGKETLRCQGHEGRVSTVAVTPDGCRAATGSGDRTVRIWDLSSGTEVVRFFADARVTSVAASASNLFVAASSDGAVHILELKGAGSMA